jgi:hypothetical protein
MHNQFFSSWAHGLSGSWALELSWLNCYDQAHGLSGSCALASRAHGFSGSWALGLSSPLGSWALRVVGSRALRALGLSGLSGSMGAWAHGLLGLGSWAHGRVSRWIMGAQWAHGLMGLGYWAHEPESP